MKQGLFANCYSTIHGLNILKHMYIMHTHTQVSLKKVKASTLFLSRNFNWSSLQAETSLS